jgi:membrane protein
MQSNVRLGDSGRQALRVLGLWVRALRVGYLRWGYAEAPLHAASIALYAVVCLGPLGILISSLVRLTFGEGGRSARWLERAIRDLGPEATRLLVPEISKMLVAPDSYATSIVTLLMIIWAGHRLFDTIERTLTPIWPGKLARGIIHRKLVCFAMLGVACLLLLAFVAVEAAFAWLRPWLARSDNLNVAALSHLRSPVMRATGFAMAALAFGLLYKSMPLQRVPGKTVLVGALFAAILWQVASPIFSLVISYSYRHGSFYGGLTGVVVFVWWALIGAEILLLGGHFAVSYEHVFLRSRPPEEDAAFCGMTPAEDTPARH